MSGSARIPRFGSPAISGTSAGFWLNPQTRYDLAVAERDHGARIAAEVARAA